jgi:hypothetical protein
MRLREGKGRGLLCFEGSITCLAVPKNAGNDGDVRAPIPPWRDGPLAREMEEFCSWKDWVQMMEREMRRIRRLIHVEKV